jgi:hypothetical protein
MLGIAAVNARIREGRLKVFRGCVNLIREAGTYRWATPEERRIVGEEPIDENNHACSALRYMVQGRDRLRDVYGRYASEIEEDLAQRFKEPHPESPEAYQKPHKQTRYQEIPKRPGETDLDRELDRQHRWNEGWEVIW